jgi:hypothetical protein
VRASSTAAEAYESNFLYILQSSNVGIGGDGVHPHRTEVILRMKCYSCVVSKQVQNGDRSWIP